jgi:hypothetical protein
LAIFERDFFANLLSIYECKNQTKLLAVFLVFKSSHQVHDKQFHHLSKLLDHDFLWVNIRIVLMNKQNNFFEIFCLKCLVFYKKTKEILVFEKWLALFDYLRKVCHHFAIVWD